MKSQLAFTLMPLRRFQETRLGQGHLAKPKRSFDMNTQRSLDWTAVRFVPLVLLVVAGIPDAPADSTGYTFQKITTLATPCAPAPPAPHGGFFQFHFEPSCI